MRLDMSHDNIQQNISTYRLIHLWTSKVEFFQPILQRASPLTALLRPPADPSPTAIFLNFSSNSAFVSLLTLLSSHPFAGESSSLHQGQFCDVACFLHQRLNPSVEVSMVFVTHITKMWMNHSVDLLSCSRPDLLDTVFSATRTESSSLSHLLCNLENPKIYTQSLPLSSGTGPGMMMMSNCYQSWERERGSHWLTAAVLLKNKDDIISFAAPLTLDSTEKEGASEGVGDARGRSECATASTPPMTHLGPCETAASAACDWHTLGKLPVGVRQSRQYQRTLYAVLRCDKRPAWH